MSPIEALHALFRENEIPMSDRNGLLHDVISAALAERDAPVALESVELQRDTHGMCTVLVNGRVAIRDNGDVISHHATLDWFSGTADKLLSEECDDGDALLRMLGLDPEQCRTEGGRLNLPKIRTALAEAEKVQTPGIYTKHLSAEQTNVDTLVVGTEGWTPANTAKAEAEPVAWRWVPSAVWKDSVLTEDPARAALAREAGIEVKPLYLHPPRRESAELNDALLRLCNAADDVGVRHFDSDDLPESVQEMQDATIAARAVLRAAGGAE